MHEQVTKAAPKAGTEHTSAEGASLMPPAFQLKASGASVSPGADGVAQRQEAQTVDGDAGNGNAASLFQGKVITGLNVRKGPGTQFNPPLEQMAVGRIVDVFETKNGWYRVGQGRWVSGSSKYVERLPAKESTPPPVAVQSPRDQVMEAYKGYSSGEMDMIGLAKALIPFGAGNSAYVLAVLNVLPEDHRDNLAFAMSVNCSDAKLATFDRVLLMRMQSELSGWLNTMSWGANWAQAERIKRVLGSGSNQQQPKPEVEKENKDGKAGNTEFQTLWAKDRLTTEEIATVRVHIEKMADGPEKQQYYVDLQGKVQYQNQRNVSSYVGEEYFGGACNLTSLAMCMSYLGLSIPAKYKTMEGFPASGVVEQLEFIRRTENTGARTTMAGWGGVAEAVGATKTDLVADEVKDRAWWETTVRDAHIKAGHAIMTSIHGHIIRIQNVTDAGVVVDDPYGQSKLDGGKKHSWGNVNDSNRDDLQTNANGNEWGAHRLGHGENVGEDHVWPWDAVIKQNFHWIVAFAKA